MSKKWRVWNPRILRRHWRFVVVISLFLLAFLFHFLANYPVFSQPFEGNLIVSQLDFTYTGDRDRLFLNDLHGVQRIELVSREQQTLVLTGRFESSQEPRLNQESELAIELEEDGQLTIAPAPIAEALGLTLEEDGQLTIAPGDSNLSGLTLEELRLQPNTAVQALSYASTEHSISFTLQPPANTSDPLPLVLNSNSYPWSITVTGYRLPSLPKLNPDDEGDSQPLEFQFTADGNTKLMFLRSTTFHITLSDPKQRQSNTRVFWGVFDGKDIGFITKVKNNTANLDNYSESTIASGAIRMGDQRLSLEKDQFLTIASPGIQHLRHIRIVDSQLPENWELQVSGEKLKASEPPQGLEVTFRGETSHIEAGIDPNVPISEIKGTLLTKFLAKDATTALYSFFSALLGLVVIWILGNPAQSNSNSP